MKRQTARLLCHRCSGELTETDIEAKLCTQCGTPTPKPIDWKAALVAAKEMARFRKGGSVKR